MAALIELSDRQRKAWRKCVQARSASERLRMLAIASGLSWAVSFVLIGLSNDLQMFGDGSFFSYSVAVQDAWTFWQNLSGRFFVYVFAYVPSQTYVGLTNDARGGVTVYGFLFFIAPLLGLIGTYLLDQSKGRVIFSYASASTACLCPLVFGFPTETWMSHSLFWPALALSHHNRVNAAKLAGTTALLLALVFTHEGALIFAFAILISLMLRGMRDAAYLRFRTLLVTALLIWIAVKTLFPPDEIMADVLKRGALHVFDPHILMGYMVVLIASALVFYALIAALFCKARFSNAFLYAASFVAVVLAIYWIWFDRFLHAENRYYLRTLILIGTPALGMASIWQALNDVGGLSPRRSYLAQLTSTVTNPRTARFLAGAFALLLIIEAVETEKFVEAWREYRTAVRALAAGAAFDPELGNEKLVSSRRLGPRLNRVAWASTTPFLSILVSPDFAPARLVADPYPGFIWLSCATAATHQRTVEALPTATLALMKSYSCLHR